MGRQHEDGRPRILIEHGKHSTNYWWVSTVDLLDRAALDILETRLGYEILDPMERDVDRDIYDKSTMDAAVTDEQIAAMPISYAAKVEVEKTRASAKEYRKWFECQSSIAKKAKELVELVSTVKTEEVPEFRWQHPGKPERVRPAYTRVYSEACEFLFEISDGREYGRLELEYPLEPAKREIADKDQGGES